MEDNYRIILEAVLNNSSLSKIKEQVQNTKIDIKPDLSIENFVKSKQDIQKFTDDIAKQMKNALSNLDDKQATKFATEYYKTVVSGIKNTTKEQEKIAKLQKSNTASEQEKYYKKIIDNNKQIYSLKEKLLTADKNESKELKRQIANAEKRNKRAYNSISEKRLGNTDWGLQVSASKRELENSLAIKKAHLEDKTIAQDLLKLDRERVKEQQTLANEMAKGREKAEKERERQIDANNKALKHQQEQQRKATEAKEWNYAKKAADIQYGIDVGDYEVKLKQLEKGFADIGKSSSKIQDVTAAYTELQKIIQSGSPEAIAAVGNKLELAISACDNELKIAKIDASGFVSTLQQAKLSNKIQSWLKNNTAATKEAKMAMHQYLNEIDANNGRLSKTDYQRISTNFDNWNTQMRVAGRLGNSFVNVLKSGVSKFTSWIGASTLVMRSIREVKNGINTVVELDDALTNINYTMDVSSSQLKDIGSSAVKASKDLRTSVSTVMDAVKTYANANETAESIIEKSKPTIMLSNISGMGIENTVDILQGTMEQFDLTEDQLMHISDVMQTVSASMPYDFAKGIKELSEGIQVSGSVAKDAGYNLENYLALLGVLIAKTRQSGSELGRSLRTMFVRTTKASSAALAGGEVTEDDLSKAETALKRVGIKVRSDVDAFRDFDYIMSDLYNKIDSLSEVDLSNIAYEVASKFVLEYIVIYSVSTQKIGISVKNR